MSALTEPQQAWVDALRSGNYRQGRSYLCDEQNRYCCLGVACEVAREHGVEVTVSKTQIGPYAYDGDPSYVPQSVMDWLGLATHNGLFNRGSVGTEDEVPSTALYGLNDHFLWSFEDIADLIEQRPQGLFVESAPQASPAPQAPVEKGESEIEF